MNQIKPRKVLVLGSGALKIGEAGEFDYSGSQALKALREEGISTVLVNPNIATIQTSEGMADRIYLHPVTPFFVEKIIMKERPDGILLSFGGQTALNCGVELFRKGVLKKYNVRVLGTPIETIIDTEDRDLFVKRLRQIGAKVPRSRAVSTQKAALAAANELGYPVMMRCAYSLGGLGSGIIASEKDLAERVSEALSHAPQVLIEECLYGWKEVEYEVVRDFYDNCITVCNMENFDPLGVHTGESIVVAPSQTLSNSEYHNLREISIRVIRHLGIIGECNIQFALDPGSEEYRIIEVNARLSRSSALASKATGYPLAFIAAKLGLGYSLAELPNNITKVTQACYEPALDYIVVKIPRWDLQKFRKASKELGTGMKSVGEVMAIGRKFEEALQKAIRMLQVGMYGLVGNSIELEDVAQLIERPNDRRLFAIVKAICSGWSAGKISSLSRIDPWFIKKIENIVSVSRQLSGSSGRKPGLGKPLMKEAKKLGFSDKQIGIMIGKSEFYVRRLRKRMRLLPYVKQIDTLAAEFPARTNYLYLTYNGSRDDVRGFGADSVMVLGSGAYRIGSSVEFDWCCVNAVGSLMKEGLKTIMVNYNPETVSTDYDICDKLYFDEISFECVADIYEKENPMGLLLSVGGQIPNNIALKCFQYGLKVLGTSPKDIDRAEDRSKFSRLLDSLGIDQPEWTKVRSVEDARDFARKMGYPILVRPSYVLSGAAMNVALNERELLSYLGMASEVSEEHPVVLSRFIENAREIEMDAVAQNGRMVISALSEHIENAGVHSGDATIVFPPQKTYIETVRKARRITSAIAFSLKINGPFNIQFIAKENEIKVIECNLRASRSFPFVSKVCRRNFIEMAARSVLGKEMEPWISTLDMDILGVKSPQFSFTRIKGADPVLGVEMASTGEVAFISDNFREAFLASLLATGLKMPIKSILLSIGGDFNKLKFLPFARRLFESGFSIMATDHTSKFFASNGIRNRMVYKAHNTHKKINVLSLIEKKKVDIVINIPSSSSRITRVSATDGYAIRRKAVDYGIPLVTNLQVAINIADVISRFSADDISIRPLDEIYSRLSSGDFIYIKK